MAKIIDGKAISALVLEETAQKVAQLKTQNKIPGLAVVLIGNDPASQVYVNTKVKTCAKLGINSYKYVLDENSTQDDVLDLIRILNADTKIHGILVQSPPPKQINEMEIVATLDPEKDVDGFHVSNVGKNFLGDPSGFVPCTPAGVMELLKRYGIETRGKHCVVLGRSAIVGRPMTALMLQKGTDATVTCCHSRTKDLPSFTRQADILIAAIGKPKFVTADMVKPGAVVIDVGINRVEDPTAPKGYRIVGDVDYQGVEPIAEAITPVPGGVGPMTIAMLMLNTVRAAEQQFAAAEARQ